MQCPIPNTSNGYLCRYQGGAVITRLMSPSHPIITDRRVHIIRDNFHNFHFITDTGPCVAMYEWQGSSMLATHCVPGHWPVKPLWPGNVNIKDAMTWITEKSGNNTCPLLTQMKQLNCWIQVVNVMSDDTSDQAWWRNIYEMWCMLSDMELDTVTALGIAIDMVMRPDHT